ncbi:C1 family peptidase, partial [Enterococcus faecalis]|uniref:C1 family peptidase n=1 Tax=Enterococcus faecalis TaxID=1351 RepID=UPI003513189A
HPINESTMKFVLVLAAVLVAASTVPHPHMVQQEWDSFKSKHVKVYKNVEEEAKRMAIFHQNLVKIEEHNKLYKQGLSTFKMGVTQFADMTSDEFMAYVNRSAVIGHPQVRGEKVVFPDVDPPESVDWRPKKVLTPVKDQGPCGASWSFAATGELESAYAIAHGELFPLSEQELIDCTGSYGNEGCNSGSTFFGFQYVADNGIAFEKDYPYEKKDGTCHKVKKSPVIVQSNTGLIPTEANLRSGIAHHPLNVVVDATALWQHYTGGCIVDNLCNPEKANHAVLAVGYDSLSWLLKNSWGSSWGEGGYIRLSKTTGCGVVDHASIVMIA